ncbi:unnamed protein product [Paramecium pentaurelia]|uniref:Uncharacterized protein n=1 Tax=Paramecium pentaurelia TaxID=43138 RepID=A0A8S1TRN8_9CILI|nr:unnamed protein product [Paramecium pentaurelia]
MFQKILNQKVKHQEDMNRSVVKEYEVVDKKIKTLHEVFNWKAHLKMNQFVKQSLRKIRMKLLHSSILIILRINQNKYNNLQQKNWRINNSPTLYQYQCQHSMNHIIILILHRQIQKFLEVNHLEVQMKQTNLIKRRNKMRQEKLEQQKIIQDIRYKNRKSQIVRIRSYQFTQNETCILYS